MYLEALCTDHSTLQDTFGAEVIPALCKAVSKLTTPGTSSGTSPRNQEK